jgi:ATP-dependent exoDNAse (exonuclease V) alpha subunit
MECLDNGIDFSKEENQVITPINKSWIGIHALNTMLQRCFFDVGPDAYALERHDWDKKAGNYTSLVVGDKVVNWKNNYDLGFFNGEGGYVKELREDGVIVIEDEERVIELPPYQEIILRGETISWNPQKDLYLGYAKTTHKTQGNEYLHCVYMLNKSAHYVVNRPNFYTASSRPRRSFQLFTDQKTIWQAVNRIGEFSPPMRKR